jgi:MoCo/4Fe-4S cofactor protein with predicted Tat translocation signal
MSSPEMTDLKSDAASGARPLHDRRESAFWRSLDELEGNEAFMASVDRELPPEALWPPDAVSRRSFMKVMAASFAMAGMAGCSKTPRGKLVPYIRKAEELTAGLPLHFGTAVTRNGYAHGVLVKSQMGRPTEVQGNPGHPASLGGVDIFSQASVLSLYDPDRSQAVYDPDGINTWDAFAEAMRQPFARLRGRRGRGLALLTGTVTSPTSLDQLRALLESMPEARWYRHEAIGDENARRGAEIAFGRPLDIVCRFDKADVIVSLDCDFLFALPGSVRYAREFADRRRIRTGRIDAASMNRLYVVESSPSITGASADHRLPLAASRVEAFAVAMAEAAGVIALSEPAGLNDEARQWARVAAADLLKHRGASVVVVGESQPSSVHALAHAVNDALGNVGHTVLTVAAVADHIGGQPEGLGKLVDEMNAGRVDVLIIIDGNPVYDAPADLRFGDAVRKVPLTVHAGLYRDETGCRCTWHLPMSHELETWADARAYDGTTTILQPLIAPLYDSRSPQELLVILQGRPDRRSYRIIRDRWQAAVNEAEFDSWWERVLRDGVVPGTRAPSVRVPVNIEAVRRYFENRRRHASRNNGSTDQRTDGPTSDQQRDPSSLELVFRPDPTTWDGRYANNGWLQGLPKPLTKLTWDNAALVSPATASRLGVENGQVIELGCGKHATSAPVWIMPGQADDCVMVTLGYGRSRAGRVGDGRGFNAYLLRTTETLWVSPDLTVRATRERYPLAVQQHHGSMHGRDLVRVGTIDQFEKAPASIAAETEDRYSENPRGPAARNDGSTEQRINGTTAEPSIYPGYVYRGEQWGMVIDLTACTGCGACTLACQAENNIPVVDKEQVIVHRDMHWLRVDRYFHGPPERPDIYHQPVPCMHCENAPCEAVCPPGATQHSKDGLNEMVYNRCIGTRYCSNNCPYKVRRFNFYRYVDPQEDHFKLQRNPEVTVRGRGVMEKCTYCVQRIRAAQSVAGREDRPIRDGEVVPACAAACPTRAIIFGNINDPNAAVTAAKHEPHNYGLLVYLGTRPRTSYLAAVRNPNVAMASRERAGLTGGRKGNGDGPSSLSSRSFVSRETDGPMDADGEVPA